ncbi:MAG: DUF4097 domain-containing protein [SAR202 cluster bacterium]|nr:hypothetical protein [Chloroflexota bacterium]MQG67488.1 DUF4097 domain-containing protein [SAR202 cluster bacterium]
MNPTTRQTARPRRNRVWRRTAVTIGALAIGMLTVVGCSDIAEEAPEIREDLFVVSDSVRLEVDGFNGSITVTTGRQGEVAAKATLRLPENIDYEATQDGDAIVIKAKKKRNRFLSFGNRTSANIEVTVPAATSISLKTSNGRINTSDISGGGTLDTSNGAVTLNRVTGEYRIETSNGRVTVRDVFGAFSVETSNGGIDFAGELTPGSDSDLRTSNGSISVKLGGEPNVQLDARTSNGTIVSRLPLDAATTERHRLWGTIGSGEADLNLQTSNGSVNIE